MKEKENILIRFFTTGFNLPPESVFRYNFKKDIIVFLFIFILIICIRIIPFSINIESENIPADLNRDDVNIFDRGLMFPYNETLDKIKYILVAIALILPVISPLSINIRNKGNWLTYGVMYSQAFILNTGVRGLKNVFDRYRPYLYFDEILAYSEFICNRSFPSGTALMAFFPAAFLSVTFSLENPSSTWKLPIIIGTFTLAIGIAVTRILSGTHFLTDVLVGAVIGAFFGWLIPMLHKRTKK
ncbi:MAG: phosphatase PAP2 family protein [Spirochaetes bacterium]|nr:phosphatase PAP2 family protein [Spirochaetota bacterium]